MTSRSLHCYHRSPLASDAGTSRQVRSFIELGIRSPDSGWTCNGGLVFVCRNTSLRDARDQVMRDWDKEQLPDGEARGEGAWHFEVDASRVSIDKEPSVAAWTCSNIAIRRDDLRQYPQVRQLRHAPRGCGMRLQHRAPRMQCVLCSERSCIAELQLIW